MLIVFFIHFDGLLFIFEFTRKKNEHKIIVSLFNNGPQYIVLTIQSNAHNLTNQVLLKKAQTTKQKKKEMS